MTTCRDIITLALRQARIVGIGRTPRAVEADEGMIALQSLYDGMFADGPLGPFTDVLLTANYTAKENERIKAGGFTVTLPTTITESGETRSPKDLSAVIVISSTAQINSVYSLGSWRTSSALALDNDAPLAERDAAGLAAFLALSYCEMFGAELPPHTERRALRFKSALACKFSTRQEPVEYF